MKHSHKYPLIGNGDEMPGGPEILEGVANAFYATGWILMLSSPKLWGALRRIPPKAFLLERLDAWLAFASDRGLCLAEGEDRAAAIARRSVPFRRLRDLLVDWEPPVVTPEIREAASALHIAEFHRPPDTDWERVDFEGIPLEAMLLWPEGEWDEEAFVASQVDNKPQSKP